MTTSDSPLSSQTSQDRPWPSTLLLLLDLDTLFAATQDRRDQFIDVGRILLNVRPTHSGPILPLAYTHRLFDVPQHPSPTTSTSDTKRPEDQCQMIRRRTHFNMGLIRDWYHDHRVRTILSPYHLGEEERLRLIVNDAQTWISSVPAVWSVMIAGDATTAIAICAMVERLRRRPTVIAAVPRESDVLAVEGRCEVRLLRFPVASGLNPLIRDLHRRQCSPSIAVDHVCEDHEVRRRIARLLPIIREVMLKEQRIENLTFLRNRVVHHPKFTPLKGEISRQEVMTILQFLWSLGILARKPTVTGTPLFLMNPDHPELTRLLDGSF